MTSELKFIHNPYTYTSVEFKDNSNEEISVPSEGNIITNFIYELEPDNFNEPIQKIRFITQYIVFCKEHKTIGAFKIISKFEVFSESYSIIYESAKELLILHFENCAHFLKNLNAIKFPDYSCVITVPHEAAYLELETLAKKIELYSLSNRKWHQGLLN